MFYVLLLVMCLFIISFLSPILYFSISSIYLYSMEKDSEIELLPEVQSLDSRVDKPTQLWNDSIYKEVNHYIGVEVKEDTLPNTTSIHSFPSNQMFGSQCPI